MDGIKNPSLQKIKVEITKASSFVISSIIKQVNVEDLNTNARRIALSLSRILAASFLLDHAEWSLQNEKGTRATTVLEHFMKNNLVEEFDGNAKSRDEYQTILNLK